MSETERYAVVWLPVGSDCNDWVFWNPLTDDGDALRLAVKLGLEIDIGVSCVIVWKRKSLGEFEQHITGKHDPYAATRRAIVRAAAEIGRAMP